RLNVHQTHGDQVGAALLVVSIHIGLVLEEVGIQLTVDHLRIGLHIVGEHLDLEFHAFLGQGWLHEFEQFRVRHGGGRHAELLRLCGGGSEQGRQGDRCNSGELLQHVSFSRKKLYLRLRWATGPSSNTCSICTMMTSSTTVTIMTSD